MKTGKDLFKPALALFFICLFASALLAFVHQLTDPVIALRDAQTQQEARMLVLPQAGRFGEEKQCTLEGTSWSYYEGFGTGGQFAGLVAVTSATGYGGEIRVMTGVDAQGTVSGVTILQLDETPGLGMKATQPEFLHQFLHKTFGVSVVKSDADENEICAITGATITSNAVTQAVNLALTLYEEVIG